MDPETCLRGISSLEFEPDWLQQVMEKNSKMLTTKACAWVLNILSGKVFRILDWFPQVFWGRDQDLVDPTAVHVHDFKSPTLP